MSSDLSDSDSSHDQLSGGRKRQPVKVNDRLLEAFSDLEGTAHVPKPKQIRKGYYNKVSRKPPRGRWTEEGDRLLLEKAEEFGFANWNRVAEFFPGKTGKQCRFRWFNYLRSDLKSTPWSEEEDTLLVNCVRDQGPKWTVLTKQPEFQGRSPNMLKNRYHVLQARVRRLRQEQSGPDSDNEDYQQPVAPPAVAQAVQTVSRARATFSSAAVASVVAAASAAGRVTRPPAQLTGQKRKSPAALAPAASAAASAGSTRQPKRARTTGRRSVLDYDSEQTEVSEAEQIESDTEEPPPGRGGLPTIAAGPRTRNAPRAAANRKTGRRPPPGDFEDEIEEVSDTSTDSYPSPTSGAAVPPRAAATASAAAPISSSGTPTPSLLLGGRRNPLLPSRLAPLPLSTAGSLELPAPQLSGSAVDFDMLSRRGSAGSLPSSQPSEAENGAAFLRRGPMGTAAAGMSGPTPGPLRGLSSSLSQNWPRLSPSRNLFSRIDSLAEFSSRMPSFSQSQGSEAGTEEPVIGGLLRRSSSASFGRLLGSPSLRLSQEVPASLGGGSNVGGGNGFPDVLTLALQAQQRLESVVRESLPSSQEPVGNGSSLSRQDSMPSLRLRPTGASMSAGGAGSAVPGGGVPARFPSFGSPIHSALSPDAMGAVLQFSQGSLQLDSRLLLREDSQPGKLYRMDSNLPAPNPFSLSQS